MDKVKINNQIISMRKFVKQAKLYVINKLSKQVRILQNKKGSEMQLEKSKRKIERFLAEIEIIKKINIDFVSKMALKREKNWKLLLKEKGVSLNDRSLALLANHELIQKEIEKFSNQNPNLISKIPFLFHQWELKKQEKTPKKSTKQIKACEIKQNKKAKKNKSKKKHVLLFNNNQNRKTTLSLNSNQGNDEEISKETITNLNENTSLDEVVKNKSLAVNPENNIEDIDQNDDTGFDDENEFLINNDENSLEEGKDDSNCSLSPSKKLKPNSQLKKNIKVNNLDNKKPSNNSSQKKENNEILQLNNTYSVKNSIKTVKPLNLDDLKDDEEIPIGDADESIEDGEEDILSSKNDPFFLSNNDNEIDNTSDNENYFNTKATTTFHKNEMFSYNDDDKRKFINCNKPFERKNNFRNKPFERKNSFRNIKPFERKNLRNNESFERRDNFKDKRNQKAFSIGNFRKVDSKSPKKFNEMKNSQFPSRSKNVFDKSLKDSKPLHPSWEAKRKMKEQLQNVTFQGKRMVFDD